RGRRARRSGRGCRRGVIGRCRRASPRRPSERGIHACSAGRNERPRCRGGRRSGRGRRGCRAARGPRAAWAGRWCGRRRGRPPGHRWPAARPRPPRSPPAPAGCRRAGRRRPRSRRPGAARRAIRRAPGGRGGGGATLGGSPRDRSGRRAGRSRRCRRAGPGCRRPPSRPRRGWGAARRWPAPQNAAPSSRPAGPWSSRCSIYDCRKVKLGLQIPDFTWPGGPAELGATLAKVATGLDVLSSGRAWLGIGAAWNESEARALGIPFPPLAERFERLEETIQICLQMWSEEEGASEGKHYQLARTLNSPQSLSRPHPPILIGGMGERKTLRLVARYAQACNLFPTPELPRKLEVLRAHCEAEGRDYDGILKTPMFNFDVGPSGEKIGPTIGMLRRLANQGIQVAIGSVKDVHTIKPLEIIGEKVIPAVAAF